MLIEIFECWVVFLTSFVFIDSCLTITESSDLPTSSVQEIVPQSEASSTETTVAVKGILECILRLITLTIIDQQEYVILKRESADLVDTLAGSTEVISSLNNHLFASGLIPKAVYNTVLNTSSSPYERANKLVSSLLSALEGHPNPNLVFSSLITSFKKVGLSAVANRLTGNLSKSIGILMHDILYIVDVETPQFYSDTHHQVTIEGSHQSKSCIVKALKYFSLVQVYHSQ